MNDGHIIVAAAILFFLLGWFTGSFGKTSDIEKKCLYGERLVFSTDKVFECKYMEGVKVK